MKLTVIEENDIEIVYQLADKGLEQMLEVDEERRKQLQGKNNFISKTVIYKVGTV